MAYGFDRPSTFGKLFPDGEFLGFYDEYLMERFHEMSAKGEARQEFFPGFKSDLIRDMHRGTDPIADDLLPKRYSLAKSYKSLGDIIYLGAGIAVSSRLRDLIEELEPGRHQIWPIEVILPSGEAYPTEYFMLRVLSQLDPFDKEKSDPSCWKKSGRILKMMRPKENHAHGIALSRSVIGDHHIWRGIVTPETGISGFNFYVSDRLKAAIHEAGLKTPPFYQLKEV
ncbi:imm11 family protein [Aliiroseovarius crassostreae]|uniref:imm11 family protein n=1 Tax=Aliiroseovarius crassostreae TaxID=154981 RepID=UPI003C7C42EE